MTECGRKKRRGVLYLTQHPLNPCLSNGADSDGWQTYVTSDVEEAGKLSAKHGILVALTDHTFLKHKVDLAKWERAYLSEPDIEWIALLSIDLQKDQDLLRLIAVRCYDYHTLPLDRSRLLVTLGHAYGMANLRATEGSKEAIFNGSVVVGTSPAMRKLRHDIRKVAAVDATVLISGESGTGKELSAHAIHEASTRRRAPFVPVNCGAIPPSLVQSELFGHEKGSFTGAHRRRIGRIESADGGSVLLDEIGDLPLDLQANLLRFLEEQTIVRVGGSETVDVDARVITATHVDLDEAVRDQRFREDLYYRLNVIHLQIPPLRERDADIELLARHFFQVFSQKINTCARDIGNDAIKAMYSYYWPGNVREMINRMQHALVMTENKLLSAKDLCLSPNKGKSGIVPLSEVRDQAEKEAIRRAMRESALNISRTARQLSVSRATLYRLINRYGLPTKSEDIGSID